MNYFGDIVAGSIIDVEFNTNDNDASSTPFTLASGVVSAYKNNSTTEGTTGVTLTLDFDGRTGFHSVRVDTSADATFFAAGNDYRLVITTGTVNSKSAVGSVVGHFSIENRTQKADIRKYIGNAVPTANVSGVMVVDTKYVNGTTQTARDIGLSVLVSSGTGTGQISLSSGNVTFGNTNIPTVGGLTPPSNWGGMFIDGSGRVDVGKVGGTVQTAADLATIIARYGRGFSTITWINTTDVAKTVIEAAVSGTLCMLAPGTHAVGNNTIYVPSGVSVVGAGIDATVMTCSFASTVAFRPGTRSYIADFTLQLTAAGIPFGADVSSGAFQNALIERFKITSTTAIDGIYVAHSTVCSMTLRDVIIESPFDHIAIAGGAHSLTLERVWINGKEASSNDTSCGIRIFSGGSVYGHDVHITLRVGTGTLDMRGVDVFDTGSTLILHDSSITLSGTATTTNLAISNDTGTVIMVDTEYDHSKVSGPVTDIFSPLRPTAPNRTLGVDGAGKAPATIATNDMVDIQAARAAKIDNLDATIQSRMATFTYVAPNNSAIADIQNRIPAALVSGRMDSSVGAMAANVITAAALATDAVGEIVSALLDTDYTIHMVANSTGEYFNGMKATQDKFLSMIESTGVAGHWRFVPTADSTATQASNGLTSTAAVSITENDINISGT